MKNKIVLILTAILIAGCGYSPSNTEILSKLNNALNIKTPNYFKLVNSSQNIAPGDLVEEFEIEFSKSDYEKLLKQINLKEWKKVEKGYQFTKTINSKAGVIVSISNNKTRVRYQYGEI